MSALKAHNDLMNKCLPRISVKERQWCIKDYDDVLSARISQTYGIPDIAARLLAQRGVKFDEVESFLSPKMSRDFPDPFSLQAMDELADYIVETISKKHKIGILADFDVDGATSSATLCRFLRSVTGEEPPIEIPDRLNDGYGPNDTALQRLKDAGCHTVFILDSGITAHDPIAFGRSIGLNIIVIDHHEPEGELPDANFIINPKRADDTSGLDMLAAVGVTFLTCVAINNRLRSNGFFETHPEPNLKHMMDLLALGTVCDMVPLTGPNRMFVREGFKQMNLRRNEGLKALLDVSKVTSIPAPDHAGFSLGPRINAGSRVHRSDLGAKLLATEDAEEAMSLAWELDDCNEKRKAIQKDMMKDALAQVTSLGRENDPIILIDDEGWHPGLSGLIAGQIKERFDRPACVVTYAKNPEGQLEGRGSGRSVLGINIAESFQAARAAGLLVKGGGHAMAGGFTVEPDKIADLRAFLIQNIEEQSKERITAETKYTTIDCVLNASSISVPLADIMNDAMGPFGCGNEEPMVMLESVVICKVDIIGSNHVRCYIRDAETGGRSIKAMAFRAAEGPLGKILKSHAANATPLNLAGNIKINDWNGNRTAELHITDAMPVW